MKIGNEPGGLEEKELRLRERIESLGSILVAYSGGVDSSYLAAVAHETLGFGKAILVTGESESLSDAFRERAKGLSADRGWNWRSIETMELRSAAYRANSSDRCYYCKSELFGRLAVLARQWLLAAVADGTNADDLADLRPGRKAAEELGAISPLAEAGMTKLDIREASRRRGLPTWDQPASPCLSSRIPHGMEVTSRKLREIEGAEAILRLEGFRDFRIRHHEREARIEVPIEEIPRLRMVFSRIEGAILRIGFESISIDPEGFRSGHLAREAARDARWVLPAIPAR